MRVQVRHALPLQLDGLPTRRSLRHLDRSRPFERLNLQLRPQRRLRKRDRHHAMQIVAIALEELVRLHIQHNVQIARRPGKLTRLALARVANPRILLHARRHLHQNRVLCLHPRLAFARRARINNQSPRPAAHRAGPRHRKEPLLKSLLAAPATLRTRHRGLALRSARTLAVRARLHPPDRDLLLLAEDRLLELQRQVIPQIASTLTARSPAAAVAAHIEHLAEKIAEDIPQVLSIEALCTAKAAASKRIPPTPILNHTIPIPPILRPLPLIP